MVGEAILVFSSATMAGANSQNFDSYHSCELAHLNPKEKYFPNLNLHAM
jgi:hypothetical protein